jgi:hypothetical protein
LLAKLTRLEVGHNDLMHEDPGQYGGENSIAALAASPHVAGLTHLGLADNFIEYEEAEYLLHSPYLNQLTSLDLSDNDVWGDIKKHPALADALRRRFGPGVRL